MKREFLFLVSLALMTRLGDLWSTYLYTPSLQAEKNPLESIFHLGWNGILVANLLITIAVVYCNYYQLHMYTAKIVNVNVRNLKEYISFICFNDTSQFWSFLFKLPKDKSVLFTLFGYAGIRTLIFGGILATLNNLFRFYNIGIYLRFIQWIKYPTGFIYGLIILSFYIFLFYYMSLEFRRWRYNSPT
jgi:hypothetical protein